MVIHLMSLSDQRLNEITQSLKRIEKKLKIIPVQDKDGNVTDFEASIVSYEEFARNELKLGQSTIDNQKSTILGFLDDCYGIISKETVKTYLDSNDSEAWKSNQLKALRKYIRDFLKLGNWIDDFKFTKTKPKIKSMPSDEQIHIFAQSLSGQPLAIFFVMLTSGLRIGEVLSLTFGNIANDTRMIDASEIHQGNTKHSWISFMTEQAQEVLYDYLRSVDFDYEGKSKLFSISARAVQQAFKQTSEALGVSINPHLLRTVFAEKCSQAGIKDKYIDAFCGRTSQGVLATSYTDYSPEALRRQYDLVEPLLTL